MSSQGYGDVPPPCLPSFTTILLPGEIVIRQDWLSGALRCTTPTIRPRERRSIRLRRTVAVIPISPPNRRSTVKLFLPSCPSGKFSNVAVRGSATTTAPSMRITKDSKLVVHEVEFASSLHCLPSAIVQPNEDVSVWKGVRGRCIVSLWDVSPWFTTTW